MKNRYTPPIKNIKELRQKLLNWFRHNKRNYPWRETKDPFKILLAEIMLRRTKADQVEKVYQTLLSEYPEITNLARAKNKKLERILFPLGLHWRTPVFRRIANHILKTLSGRFPTSRDELKKLPGIGDYVAGAVLSIAFNKSEWIVDSNIARLYKRYFGIETFGEGRRDSNIISIAKTYAASKTPRKANLAILDFSALICKPRNPRCVVCPLMGECRYLKFLPRRIL